MKKIKYIVITILLLITITNININVEAKQITHKTKIQTTTNKKQKNYLSIYSNNAILYNLKDNEILFQKNKDQKVSIASLTKMMTALIAIENINDLNEKVSFQKSDYQDLIAMDASASSLNHEKQYSYNDILHGLMMESGADCANILARLVGGNEETFVKMMNQKAKQLGMKNTSFANPIGMDDKNNYSTMSDLVLLFKAGLKNDTWKKIATTMYYTLEDGTKIEHTIKLYERNAYIKAPYILGGKTGYETDAGYALATIANKNNTTLIFITSKTNTLNGHIKDAKKIYEYYFNNYGYQTILKKGEIIKELDTKYLSEDKITITANEDIKYYLKNDYNKNDIKLVYDGIDEITYKNKYMENIGTLSIYYKDKLVKTTPVYLNQKIYPDFKLIILAGIVYMFIIGCTIIISNRLRHKKQLEQI